MHFQLQLCNYLRHQSAFKLAILNFSPKYGDTSHPEFHYESIFKNVSLRFWKQKVKNNFSSIEHTDQFERFPQKVITKEKQNVYPATVAE